MENINQFPLVSINMPVYNQENLIVETLESVLAQDYPNMEIVICDDCSHDNTAEIIESFIRIRKDKHIFKFIRNGINKGITATTNVLIENSHGKYICFFSGDDLMYAGKISRQVQYMEQHPECYVLYHDVNVYDTVANRNLYKFSERHTPRSGDYATLIQYGSFNCACSNMIRSTPKVYANVAIHQASDWYHFVEILYRSKGEIHYLNDVLGVYRRHSNNITKTMDIISIFQEKIMTYDLFAQNFPESRTLTRRIKGERMMSFGVKIFLRKHIFTGMKLFFCGLMHDPLSIFLFMRNAVRHILHIRFKLMTGY